MRGRPLQFGSPARFYHQRSDRSADRRLMRTEVSTNPEETQGVASETSPDHTAEQVLSSDAPGVHYNDDLDNVLTVKKLNSIRETNIC